MRTDEIQIIEAGPADVANLLDIHRAAFAGEDEADLVVALLQDRTARPSLSLLAFVAGQAVGHVLFTHARLADAPRQASAALLAPLAVRPAFQRQGVGRALIEEGARLLAASGAQLVFVLGDPAYYTKAGFVPAFPFGLRAPYPIVAQEAWMVRSLAPEVLGCVTGVVGCAQSLAEPAYWRE